MRRFELPTSSVTGKHSRPLSYTVKVGETRFELVKAEPTILQTVPINHSGTLPLDKFNDFLGLWVW